MGQREKPTFKQKMVQANMESELILEMSFACERMEIGEAFDGIRHHNEDYQAGFEEGFRLGRDILYKHNLERVQTTLGAYNEVTKD